MNINLIQVHLGSKMHAMQRFGTIVLCVVKFGHHIDQTLMLWCYCHKLWHELAQFMTKSRVQRGDQLWQIAFGLEFKYNRVLYRGLCHQVNCRIMKDVYYTCMYTHIHTCILTSIVPRKLLSQPWIAMINKNFIHILQSEDTLYTMQLTNILLSNNALVFRSTIYCKPEISILIHVVILNMLYLMLDHIIFVPQFYQR